MLIKDRIKDFDKCIFTLEVIRDFIDDLVVENACSCLIDKLKELREVFIMAVTYSEVH